MYRVKVFLHYLYYWFLCITMFSGKNIFVLYLVLILMSYKENCLYMIFKTYIYILKSWSEVLVESYLSIFLPKVVTLVENCNKWVWYYITLVLRSVTVTYFFLIPTCTTIIMSHFFNVLITTCNTILHIFTWY